VSSLRVLARTRSLYGGEDQLIFVPIPATLIFLLKNSHVWPGCRRAQMVCFRAVGAHGRARCSIALRAMTRLKFSSAIRLRNFRDLILIGGGHPSLISSGSRSQRQIDMAVTPNSFCTCGSGTSVSWLGVSGVSTSVASVAVAMKRHPFENEEPLLLTASE